MRCDRLGTARQKSLASCALPCRKSPEGAEIHQPRATPWEIVPKSKLSPSERAKSNLIASPNGAPSGLGIVQNSQGVALGFRVTAPSGLLHSPLITNFRGAVLSTRRQKYDHVSISSRGGSLALPDTLPNL